jgi:dTDP-L-rhamnose 4-epimerase
MRVLITGGAGFIGTCLARRLLAEGSEVTILDSFEAQIHAGRAELAADLRLRARLVRADVRDPAAVQEALEAQEAIVHLAAETGTGQSMYELRRYADVNVLGTANVLEQLLAVQQRPRRFILASSRAVYGEGPYECNVHGVVCPKPRSTDRLRAGRFDPECPACEGACLPLAATEETPLRPASWYGVTKVAQEHEVALVARVLGMSCFVLRLQNVYGPGQSLHNPYTGVLAIFASVATRGGRLEVYEDGLVSRDFVYIDDAVEAFVRCLRAPDGVQSTFNVGSGERSTIADAARHLVAASSTGASFEVTGAFRVGDVRHSLCDISKARTVLGYSPRRRLGDGLRDLSRWVESSGAESPDLARANCELERFSLLARASQGEDPRRR